MTDVIHQVTEKLHKPMKNHNTWTNNGIYRLAKRSFYQGKFILCSTTDRLRPSDVVYNLHVYTALYIHIQSYFYGSIFISFGIPCLI